MPTQKLQPGELFPVQTVSRLGGDDLPLGTASAGYDWQLMIVYRGKHCPLCTRYLIEIQGVVSELTTMAIEVVAVSADSEDRAAVQAAEAGVTFPIGYGLSVAQMQQLGLYISSPRHGMDTQHPFAEPGLFLVDGSQELRMVDISNVPFLRPRVTSLVAGLRFMRGMSLSLPANGSYAA